MPRCRGFWITEFALNSRLAVSASGRSLWYATWELGRMVNTGRGSAFGATLFVGADGDGYRWGLKPRYRHWLNATTSLELAPGILLGGTDTLLVGGYPRVSRLQRFPSVTGHASLNFGDWIAVIAQLEAIRGTTITTTDTPSGPVVAASAGMTNVTGYVGVKLGSYPGAIAAVVAPVATLIAVASSFGGY